MISSSNWKWMERDYEMFFIFSLSQSLNSNPTQSWRTHFESGLLKGTNLNYFTLVLVLVSITLRCPWVKRFTPLEDTAPMKTMRFRGLLTFMFSIQVAILIGLFYFQYFILFSNFVRKHMHVSYAFIIIIVFSSVGHSFSKPWGYYEHSIN